jgi:uncharacterized membrane protein
MAEITLIPVDSQTEGMAVLERLDDAVQDGTISIQDAALVYKTSSGKVKLHQTRGLTTGKGIVRGAVLGTLVGVMAGPIGWAALGGGVLGGMWGKLRDKGVSNDFMKEVGRLVDAGKAVVFVLADESSTATIDAFAGARNVEHYTLPEEAQKTLEEAIRSERRERAA